MHVDLVDVGVLLGTAAAASAVLAALFGATFLITLLGSALLVARRRRRTAGLVRTVRAAIRGTSAGSIGPRHGTGRAPLPPALVLCE